MHLLAAVVLLALAAEPQCPTDPTSCRSSILPSHSGNNNDQMCNTTTWMVYDYCDKLCPMRLVITEPPELRTWMCAMDNSFEPYAPDAHIDLYHPLNNQELEIEAVGHADVGATRRGCEASDYSVGNKSFAGKIVLGKRGTCGYSTKALRAQTSGAAMMFVVDYWSYYTFRSMRGSSAGIENFPSLFAARHEADYVLAALDKGVKVKGKFQYQCNDMPEGYLDNPQDYPWDKCGTNTMALQDTCTSLEKEQEPLCEVCTVELQLPGAEKLCLFGNNLRPRKKETLLDWAPSWELPYTSQKDEIVYATELANRGCSVSDYTGLAGKIILIPETGRCPLVHTVRSAQQAGVKAYILITSTYYLQWYRIRAYSHNITIPVHTVDYHTTPKLQAFVANGGGRHIPGTGYSLDGMTFTRGVPPATDPPTPAPLPPIVVDNSPKLDTSPDFEMSAGTVVCIIVVCVDVVVLAVLFVQQRRDAVQLPDEVRAQTFSIPLKVASMGLSLTLLMLIAVVSFSLATMAGQDSTDKAMDNGRAALGLSYDSSEKNTIELADTIRGNTIDRVLGLMRKEILHMEYRLKVVEDIFFGFDGSWLQFDARTLTMWRMMRNADASYENVQFQIFTTRGFFLNHHYKTDDRPDAQRADGVVGTVAETNEGWRYGASYFSQEYITRQFFYGTTVPVYQANASRMLAGNIGDPIAVTSSQATSHTTWKASKLTYPLAFHAWYPMSAYRPLYGGEGQYHGTIEVHQQLGQFSTAALDTESLATGSLQNMSVMILDTDGAILGSYNIDTDLFPSAGTVHHDSIERLRGIYYMHEHPAIRVTALANYLDSVNGWTKHAGEFDQQEHFSEQPYLTLAKITVSGGRAADTGVHNWDVEMRDGACGACVAYDDQLQKEVLVFDGATTLHVYRNLTRRTPIVAKSQVSGAGEPWRSKYEVFNDKLTLSDGTECVARTWHTTATESTTRCMLRPDITGYTSFMVSMRIRPDVAYTETSPRATTPRLFSDSLVGDANIRLFANGQLYLFVLRYGCRTKAYEGGFPVRAWTTITASIGGGYCRVYVNGTLHSESIDARGGKRVHSDPYRSGQFFKGRMDSLQVFRYSMSDAEIKSLHTGDKLVRDVPSKRYFAQTKTLDVNVENKRVGVKWTVAVMIPRDDIMRVVDANRRETLSDVQIQEDNTKKELTQRANATIMIIVAIGMTSVVVFLVFNNMMTRPFTVFAQEIMRVSQVDVEGIATLEGDVSLLREINVMRRAINTLVVNMREYKTFMPEAIFSREPVFAESHPQEAPGLESGHAAVLFTDVQGSTQLWEACTEEMAEALRLHNTVIREVIAEHGGYEVKTIGDAFMVSFPDLDAAVRFGLRAQERLFQAAWPAGLLEVVQAPGDEGRGLRGLRVRMGLTHGPVNVERNDVVHRCDYFGPTVNRAARLEGCGMCGAVALEESALGGLACVHDGDAIVVAAGKRTLKGIGDGIAISLLLPPSLDNRAAFFRDPSSQTDAKALNPLKRPSRSESQATLGSGSSCFSAASVGRRHAPLRVVDRFEGDLTEVSSATLGFIDSVVVDESFAAVTDAANDSLRHMINCLGRSDGRLLNVCGTAALVAWNVMSPCAGHVEGSLRFVNFMAGSAVHCGLSSGKVFTGYVGAGKQRFVTAVGQSVQVCLRAHILALQEKKVVLFATQDAQLTQAMASRGFATPAGDLHTGSHTYTVSEILLSVVATLLEAKRHGLFDGPGHSKDQM